MTTSMISFRSNGDRSAMKSIAINCEGFCGTSLDYRTPNDTCHTTLLRFNMSQFLTNA